MEKWTRIIASTYDKRPFLIEIQEITGQNTKIIQYPLKMLRFSTKRTIYQEFTKSINKNP